MALKMKNGSHRHETNRTRPRHGHKYTKYKMCLSMIMVCAISNTLATSETTLMEKLSNIEAELKKSLAYKNKRVPWLGSKK